MRINQRSFWNKVYVGGKNNNEKVFWEFDSIFMQKLGQHSLPSIKLTFPFLFNLRGEQSTSDFKSTSKKQ